MKKNRLVVFDTKIKSQIKEKTAVYKRFSKVINLLFKKREVIRKEINDLVVEDFKSNPPALTPRNFMKRPSEGASHLFKYFNDWLEKEYFNRGIKRSGMFDPDTNQDILAFNFNNSKPLKDQMGIMDFIPFIRSDKVQLPVTASGRWLELSSLRLITSYGTVDERKRIVKFNSLEEAIKHIYDNYPDPYFIYRKCFYGQNDCESLNDGVCVCGLPKGD